MKKFLCSLLIATLCLQPLIAQEQTPVEMAKQIQLELQKVQTDLAQLITMLEGTPKPPTVITTGTELEAAIAAAAPGAVITLSESLIYVKALKLSKAVTLQFPLPGSPDERMTKDRPLPHFTASLSITGDNITVVGVDIRNTDTTDIVTITGKNITLDRVRILGDPVKGAKRGVASNGNGNVKIINSFIDDCFLPSPGQDSQAIIAWDMAPGLLIKNNYLSGGSETLLFGGADNSSDDRTPADITVQGNTITKNAAWQGQKIGVKNLVEFKNAKRVVFENNDCSLSWVQGQGGYLLVLTVRNQDGRAPWSTIQDAVFRNNKWSSGTAAINIIGRDDIKEYNSGKDVPIGTVRRSVPMSNVVISGDTFEIDPIKYGGSNTKAIQIGGAPISLTIDNVKLSTLSKVGSAVYFTASSSTAFVTEGFKLTNVTMPKSSYGLFGEGVSAAPLNWTNTNPAWVKYTQNGVIGPVTVQ